MRSVMLLCAFTGAILSHTASISQNAAAGSGEGDQVESRKAQTSARVAQNTGAAKKAGSAAGEQKLTAWFSR